MAYNLTLHYTILHIYICTSTASSPPNVQVRRSHHPTEPGSLFFLRSCDRQGYIDWHGLGERGQHS
ncbi:predicted protein [Plenodomus lingam JN3]|uniref:Predicted protein n=1 Tax=Leptosphaeria maculans (strain JN3 / isolate v23.1.3 / race Av1-4-5-6-7-8) TaxID=985895 RepID=E4ZZN6_LEPMJ|nr:predicted protein [Plenodomus lingam JN3]CBX97152.1 predicted protein [Plenodomus lingam JN3]